MKNLFIFLLLVFFSKTFAQISGNSTKGSSDMKEFIPVGSKEQTGEVDLFTGTYGQTQTLGTVSTPSGLTFSLSLTHSSTTTTGQNLPFIDGIPYGEGWNLNLPFISISTASLLKFNSTDEWNYAGESDPTNPDGDRFSEYELKNTYGQLSWFAPYLHIPGVASGRLVFKYMRETHSNIDQGVAIFVLENFDTYIEASFNGLNWAVTLPDGTVYSFNNALYTVINPTNQRVSKHNTSGDEVLATNSTIVRNVTEPNKTATSWYVSIIRNPSKHHKCYLRFEYNEYGKFNFHDNNDFIAGLINTSSASKTSNLNLLTGPKYLSVARDLFLRKIKAVQNIESDQILNSDDVNSSVTEYLELNYAEDNTLTQGHPNMLYASKTDCELFDDLYVKETIYKKGYFNSEQSYNFEDWKRYKSPKQLENENGLPPVSISRTNPYVYVGSGSILKYVRKDIANNSNNIAFDHSFLESIKFNRNGNSTNKFMPGGEIYEVKAKIESSSNTAFCMFDINITSLRNEEQLTNSTTFSGYEEMTEQNYNQTRDNTITSTFDQAEKFKANIYNSSGSTFNKLFVLPVLPATLADFVVQIGPANSDNDFSIDPNDIALNSSGDYRIASTYYNNPNFIGAYSTYKNKTALKCPSNFGAGYPWYMIFQYYKNGVVKPGTALEYPFKRAFNTWWGATQKWGTSDPTKHNYMQSTLSKNIFLENFEINRYSKRPYVLKSVKHYILNATTNSAHTAQTGPIFYKTMELNFIYDVIETAVYASTISDNSTYTSNSVYDRYVIVLKEVINNTDNSAPTVKKLKTKYSYSTVSSPFLVDDLGIVNGTHYYTYEQGGDAILLNKVETATGSIKDIIYYDWGISGVTSGKEGRMYKLSTYQNFRLFEMDIARLGLSKLFSGPSNTYEMSFIIKEIKEKITNSDDQTTKYSFSEPIDFKTYLPNNQSLKDENGNNISYKCEHHGQSIRVRSGYRYSTVNYGNSTNNINGIENKIKYTFSSNEHYFGKTLISLSYTELNSVLTNLKKTEYFYEESKAYENGFFRLKRLGSTELNTIPISFITPKYANVALEYDYSDYNTSFISQNTSLIDLSQYYTVNNPATNTPGYLNKSIVNTNGKWELWEDRVGMTLHMEEQRLGLFGVSKIGQKVEFIDHSIASYFIKLKQVKITDFEFEAPNSQVSNVIIKDFEYYDADYKGLTNCKGYGFIKDDFTSSQFSLMYEPSWQLYSIKEYSESIPSEYTLKENFYYYDLIQKYNVANFDVLGTTKLYTLPMFNNSTNIKAPYFISQRIKSASSSLGSSNLLSNTPVYGIDNFMNFGLEAMCNSQFFGVRNLLMEERVSTSSLNDSKYDDHYKSTYYLYKKSNKQIGNETYNKTTSFINSTEITTTSGSQRFPNTTVQPSKIGLSTASLTPNPVKRLDDYFNTINSTDIAARALYVVTGGYNKEADVYRNIYSNEALIKHCFSNNSGTTINNSGHLFKLTLQSVKDKLNAMYNVNMIDRFDSINNFNILSDESVYNEFRLFGIEDFIPMAIQPNSAVSEQDYYKLMNLEFEAVKALMCYAIQDTIINVSSIISSLAEIDVSNFAYKILTGKDVIDIENEKEYYRPPDGWGNGGSFCYYPINYFFSEDKGPKQYFLQLDKVYTQIDDGIDEVFYQKFPQLCIANGYSILEQPNRLKRPILHFKVKELDWNCGSLTAKLSEKMEPYFPYAVLKLNEITDINLFGASSETKNELELTSKLDINTYNRYQLYKNSGTPGTNTFTRIYVGTTFEMKNISLPIQLSTSGDGVTYIESITYDNLNRVTKTTDMNGLETETIYDGFSNIIEIKINGLTREKKDLSFWNFDAPTINSVFQKNYSESILYSTSNTGVITRNYFDRSGRPYQTVSQDITYISSNLYANYVNYSGLILYDKWGRITNTYKPFGANKLGSSLQISPDFSSVNIISDLKTSIKLSDDLKSRELELAPYGRSLGGGHSDIIDYYLINGNTLLTELGLSTSGADDDKIKLILLTLDPSPNYSNFKYYKKTNYDADNRKTVTYTNIWGQIISIVTFPTSVTKSVTINGYNSQGKLKQSINPTNISTYYSYNWRGDLIEKASVDAGTVRYMYDQAGNLVLEQTEKMRSGQEHSMPYYRGYEYDKRGRLTKQYVANQKFTKNADFNFQHINNPSLDTALKKVLPLVVKNTNISTGGSPSFNFSYNHDKYENLNTYSWMYQKQYTYTTTFVLKGIDKALDDKIYEKEFYYDEFPSIYKPNFHSSISNTTTNALNYTQNNLLGKLALEISYNSDFITSICASCGTNKLIYMRFYSYDIEKRPEWEIQEFNENGIGLNNIGGEVVKIDYLDYNYNNKAKTKNVYLLNSSGNIVFNRQFHYTFDIKNRPSTLYFNNLSTDLNNGRKIASLDYNPELGFNDVIKYYRTACGTSVEVDKIDFDYTSDPQNRLSKINTNKSDFSFEIFYDNTYPSTLPGGLTLPSVSNNYNGNITATIVKYPNGISNFSQPYTFYGYTYDGNNRLTNANGLLDASNIDKGDETYTYDLSGNFLSLIRKNTNFSVDDFTYEYITGNQLNKIQEQNPSNSRNYTYDKDGNITFRPFSNGRQLNQIVYGRANLPFYISDNTAQPINYLYNTDNIRICRKHNGQSEFYLYDMNGEMLCVINRSTYLPIDWYAGIGKPMVREDASGELYNYIYDHLGNTRVTYKVTINCSPIIVSTVTYTSVYDYFPFGKVLRYSQSTQERTLTTGNERDGETGGLEGLDYRIARMYDCEIGRFLSIDPMCHLRLQWSVYNYCRNNPILNIDPNGALDDWVEDAFGNITWRDDVTLAFLSNLKPGEIYRGVNYRRFENIGSTTYDDVTYNSDASKTSTHKIRPDADRYVTQDEAIDWYHFGGGRPLTVDVWKYNYKSSFLSMEDFITDEQTVDFFNGWPNHPFLSHVIWRPASNENLSDVFGTFRLVVVNRSSGLVKPVTNPKTGYFDVFNYSGLGGIAGNNLRQFGNPKQFGFIDSGTGTISIRLTTPKASNLFKLFKW